MKLTIVFISIAFTLLLNGESNPSNNSQEDKSVECNNGGGLLNQDTMKLTIVFISLLRCVVAISVYCLLDLLEIVIQGLVTFIDANA